MRTQYYQDPQGFDLREEMTNTLHGDYQHPGIGRPVMVRRLTDTHCVCWDGLTGSPLPSCKYCQGEGFRFRETIHKMYIARNFGTVLSGTTPIQQQGQLSSLGIIDSHRCVAYCEYDVFPDYERYTRPDALGVDKLYELKVTDTGDLYQPIVRTAKWKIRSLTPHHGDWGRVEFIELGLDAELL